MTASTGNWYQLLSIVREGMGYVQIEPQIRLMACPNDGEPYSQGPDGALFCRYDGFRPDGTYVGDYQPKRTFTRY